MSAKTRIQRFLSFVQDNQPMVRSTTGVPSMGQYNGVRDRVKTLEEAKAADELRLSNLETALQQFAKVAKTGAYGDLSGTPLLAAVATSGSYSDLSGRPTLATVATSGSYSDLTGKPTFAPIALSGNYIDLTNKPALSALALSGSFADLQNVPDATTTAKGQTWFAGDGAATAGRAVQATDTRLSNPRTPTAHKSTHATGATDALAPADIGAATQTDLTAHATNTANPHVVTKAQVGLANVDNTADSAKPVSTAQQTAIDARLSKSANLSDLGSAATARTNLGLGGAATLNVGTAAGTVAAGNDGRFVDARQPLAHKSTHATGGSDALSPADIGLGNVNNTSDANKPISTATQAALDGKASTAVATATTNGLMSAAQFNKLAALGLTAFAAGTATTPAVTLVTPVDVTITLSGTMPNSTYSAFPYVEGGVVGKLTPTIKSKTATTVTVTLTASIAVTLGAGAVSVLCWSNA